jgi:hypothetical protein
MAIDALTFSAHKVMPEMCPVSGSKQGKQGKTPLSATRELLLRTADTAEPLPSLSFIADGAQTTRATLKRHHPNLYRQVMERRIAERKKRTAKLLAKQARIIGEIVEQMRDAGVHPGRKRVEGEIRRDGFSLMTQPNLVAFRNAYISSMGLVSVAEKSTSQ